MNRLTILTTAIFALSAFTLFVACGDDEPTGNGNSSVTEPDSLEDFHQRLTDKKVEAHCQAIFDDSCNNFGQHEPWLHPSQRARNVNECLQSEEVRHFLRADVEALQTLIDEDRAEFDSSAAQSCLTAVNTRRGADDCWSPTADPPGQCDDILNGFVEDDEPCVEHQACESGFCLPGFHFTDEDECWGRCSSQREFVGEGDECSTYEHEFACDPDDSLICQDDLDDDQLVCSPIGSRQEGEDCRAGRSCDDGLACGGYQCATIEFREAGETCGFPDPLTPCRVGLACSGARYFGAEGVCTEVADLNEDCEYHEDCSLGHICDGGSCQNFLEAGEECPDHEACGPGVECRPEDLDPSNPTVCQPEESLPGCELPDQ